VRVIEVGGALGIDQDGEGRYAELRAVKMLERLEHGGGKIHATAHWFGEDDVRPYGQEALGGGDEIAEAAAEACAGDFSGIEAGCGGHAGIHQRAALIVGDDGGAQAATVEQARGAQQQGGLARAEESSDQDQERAIRQAAPTLRRRG
jgi:hypothetical protein